MYLECLSAGSNSTKGGGSGFFFHGDVKSRDGAYKRKEDQQNYYSVIVNIVP